MRPIKNADVPRRSGLWVQKKHHKKVKLLGAMLGISPYGLIVEAAIDEYLDSRPGIKAAVEKSLQGGVEAG